MTCAQDLINKNGYTARDLAKKVGVNESTISRYVRLLNLSDDIQQKVAAGIIPPSIAREAARLNGEAEQQEFIDKMMSGNFSTVDAHKVASGRKVKKRRTKRNTKSSALFETDYGTVAIEFRQVEKPTYDHALEMLNQAIDEAELRIRNNSILSHSETTLEVGHLSAVSFSHRITASRSAWPCGPRCCFAVHSEQAQRLHPDFAVNPRSRAAGQARD